MLTPPISGPIRDRGGPERLVQLMLDAGRGVRSVGGEKTGGKQAPENHSIFLFGINGNRMGIELAI